MTILFYVLGLIVVMLLADVIYQTNWKAVFCTLRGKHKMDMYTHRCACGAKRKTAI